MLARKRIVGSFVILLFVAACTTTAGTATSPSDGQPDTGQGATPTLPSDTGTVVSNAPDASATVYVETEGVPVGGFKATVSGDFEGDWEGGARADTYPPRTGTTLTFVAPQSGTFSYGVLIEVPADTPPGTYTLGNYNLAISGLGADRKIVNLGAQFSAAGTNTIDLLQTIPSGTLILSEVEPTMTGRFEFTATDGENTVNVVGTFNQVEITTND
jgi:hypothetical protein